MFSKCSLAENTIFVGLVRNIGWVECQYGTVVRNNLTGLAFVVVGPWFTDDYLRRLYVANFRKLLVHIKKWKSKIWNIIL